MTKMNKTVYISGPMRGIQDFNYPAFNAAAAAWRDAGWTVHNPAEQFGGNQNLPLKMYLGKDMELITQSDAIALLPGWAKSQGAQLELHYASVIGLSVFDAVTMKPFAESALQEAQRLVHGDRGDSYGHPLDDFEKTARIWSVIIGKEVQPEQVALCMVGVKISRELNKPKRDNRVDGAGYFETLQMIHDERLRRK